MIAPVVFALTLALGASGPVGGIWTPAAATDRPVSGQEIQRAGPSLFYLHGRGVLRVPAGWSLKETIRNKLMFEKVVFGPYEDMCEVIPGVYSNADTQAWSNATAVTLVEDTVSFFNRLAGGRTQVASRRWAAPYRGLQAARFSGSFYVSNAFGRADGSKIGGYMSVNSMTIARAHVSITIRCSGLRLNRSETIGAEMFSAIDIDPSRPYVLNIR